MHHRLTIPTVSLAVLGLALAAPTIARTPAPGQTQKSTIPKTVSYQKHIRPLLAKYCTGCHGAKKPAAELNLSTPDGIKKGSEDGKIYVAKKSKESLIMKYLNGDPKYGQMPPAGKLKADQIATVARWIDQGAKFDKAK